MYREEHIIQALSQLKKQRKYPAFPKNVLDVLKRPENEKKRLGDFLQGMAAKGIIRSARRGKHRGGAYMLAGDDPRYTKTPNAKLKFELLAEIEDLKAKLLESRAAGSVISEKAPHADARRDVDVEKRILETIRRLSKAHKRRAVDVSDIRRELKGMPASSLEAALEKLGGEWKIELQPVQDITKLSEGQKQGLLILSDGTRIGAIAIATDR
jgi:hypothetical protein